VTEKIEKGFPARKKIKIGSKSLLDGGACFGLSPLPEACLELSQEQAGYS
jgi:hypothetical protein